MAEPGSSDENAAMRVVLDFHRHPRDDAISTITHVFVVCSLSLWKNDEEEGDWQ